MSKESAILGALNDVTPEVTLFAYERYAFSLFDTSSFVGTVALERSYDGGASYRILATETAEAESDFVASTAMRVRLRVSAYTGGAISGEINSAGFPGR